MFLSAALWMVGVAPAQDLVEKGRAAYVAKCQACHGAEGKGDGPAARALPEKLADFTSRSFWDRMDDEKLKTAIRQGRPGSPMRSFPMPDEQMNALVAYLNTLKPTG